MTKARIRGDRPLFFHAAFLTAATFTFAFASDHSKAADDLALPPAPPTSMPEPTAGPAQPNPPVQPAVKSPERALPPGLVMLRAGVVGMSPIPDRVKPT